MAERKNEKKEKEKEKERKKERKKGAPAGGATFADLRLPSTFARRIVFPARYRSNRITLTGYDPFSANLRSRDISHRVIRHRSAASYRRERGINKRTGLGI